MPTLMREPEVEGGTPTGLSENLVKSIITFLEKKTKINYTYTGYGVMGSGHWRILFRWA